MNRTSRSLPMYYPLAFLWLGLLLVSASLVCAQTHGPADNNSSRRSVNSLESYPAVEAFLGDCMQNYGPKAVDLVKDQWSKTGVCLERIFFGDQPALNEGLLIRMLAASTSPSPTTTSLNDAPITILCHNHIPDIEKCIRSFIVALKGCTAVKGDEDLQSLGNALSGALKYACQRDGDGIVRFVQDGGTECLKEPYDRSILDCFQLRDSLLPQLQQGNASIFDGANCRIHQQSDDCVVRMFQQCTTPSSSVKHLVGGLLGAFMNETKCRNNNIQQAFNDGRSGDTHSIVLLLCMALLLHSLACRIAQATF
ncbi:uncharacterized protein LOC124311311 [Daphnia pulicaria]|uniref:uncharacterized protein LOC124311311 n=1 Tax=Daphnia pulicaria TaxID=35523 RepID=UPI001EEB74F5|nr:uncharacterized protein LOC124311311 [Daphnia pulicaria]